MESISDVVSFRNCRVLNNGNVIVLAGYDEADSDDVAHTVVIEFFSGTENFEVYELDFTASFIETNFSVPNEIYILGRYGDFYQRSNGIESRGSIYEDFSHNEVGSGRPIRFLGLAGNQLFAVGMSGLVYRKEVNGVWDKFEKGLSEDDSVEAVIQSGKALCAVGWQGKVWVNDKEDWLELETPTSVILTDLCEAPDGIVYCCGQAGVLIRGQGSIWESVEFLDEVEEFWSVEEYRGKIYVSSQSGIYVLEDKWKEVDFGLSQYPSCYKLVVSGDLLISYADKAILSFDGERWAKVC